MIGGWLGAQVLSRAAGRFPALAPWVLPLILLYGLFALFTWIAVPLFNLLLLTNRYGRLALSRDQTMAARWVGLCLGLAGTAGVAAFAWNIGPAIQGAIVCALMTIPVFVVFQAKKGKTRLLLGGYALALALMGIGSAALALWRPAAAREMGNLFFYGVLASTIIGNVVVSSR